MTNQASYDVVIIGGGPAGLSAAVVLAHCTRTVAVCDHGHPRNYAAQHMSNYLTRNGIAPAEFRKLSRDEVVALGIPIFDVAATEVAAQDPIPPHPTRFTVKLEDGRMLHCHKVLFATGLSDRIPTVPGTERLYGKGIHHCPYCDAYPYRGRHLIAFGEDCSAVGLSLSLKGWSENVTLCTNGQRLENDERATLYEGKVVLREERVEEFIGEQKLEAIRLEDGTELECAALFFNSSRPRHCDLAQALGCTFSDKGEAEIVRRQETAVPGVYFAGDADGDVQFVVVAASEGAKAAVAINCALLKERGPEALRLK